MTGGINQMPKLTTVTSRKGMVTAPHYLAAEAGLGVLRDGGNAVEASVAARASHGGTAPDEVRKRVAEARVALGLPKDMDS